MPFKIHLVLTPEATQHNTQHGRLQRITEQRGYVVNRDAFKKTLSIFEIEVILAESLMNQKKGMDTLDWRILEHLQKQGRASYAEIGRAVGLSAPAVTERVQKMEDAGIILGYKAVVAPEKIGYPIQTIIQLQVNRDRFAAALKKLRAMPAVMECYRTTGTSSLFMLAVFKTMHQMEQFLNEVLQIGEPVSSIVLSHPITGHIFSQKDATGDAST